MRNRLNLVCGLLLVAAALGLLWWSPWEPREPVYDGKPIRYWLAKSGRKGPQGLSADTNALPFLIKALKRDSWVGAAVYRKQVWPKLPQAIQKHLPPRSDSQFRRCAAAAWLRTMQATAERAIPALVQALDEDDNTQVRGLVVMSLVDLDRRGDSNVVAALTGAVLSDYGSDHPITPGASRALGQLSTREINSTPTLLEALKDRKFMVRFGATNLLLDLDPEAAAKAGIKRPLGLGELKFLTRDLSDEDKNVRAQATNRFWELDPAAAARAHSRQPN
jgi:HEAT repeat protein